VVCTYAFISYLFIDLKLDGKLVSKSYVMRKIDNVIESGKVGENGERVYDFDLKSLANMTYGQCLIV
jgi:hypothetical protein